MVVKINGDIVSNDWKAIYDWFKMDSFSPSDLEAAIERLPKGEALEIKINSPGGDVWAGQEIYTMLRGRDDVAIEVESTAASAASIIAMAGKSSISPVGMLMIHNVSMYGASGNKRDMKKAAETLGEYDKALAAAYAEKTGMELDEVLKLMDKEAWLTAAAAVELGFIDAISEPAAGITNAISGMRITPEMVAEYEAAMKDIETREKTKNNLLEDLDMFGA